ncbi:hypothetical protein Q5O14_12645 [Eubacteriaceae bacterium ES2]|nr:hypothetical protein Q5O14_12645 [Eubacteriaceae bacterium ES2]
MKRKFTVMLLTMALIFPMILNSSVLAAEMDEDKETLSADLTVEIQKDGSVAPVENTSQLSEANLNLILERIGYPVDSIQNWDIARKRRLASYGGVVVNGYITDSKHDYVSSDGSSYEVTEYNENEIRNIQIEDLRKAGVTQSQIDEYNLIEVDTAEESVETRSVLGGHYTSFPGEYKDDKWSAQVSVARIGETSTQIKYVVTMDYFWEEAPTVHYGDVAGLTWASYGSPIANTASSQHAINLPVSNLWSVYNNTIDTSNNLGITADLYYSPAIQLNKEMGYLEEQIFVSKGLIGQQQAISAAYGHPWFSNNWSLSIGVGGLSFSNSITNGDQWSWRYNFTVL